MLFVGAGQDENLLRQKIDELALNDCITLCGKISDRELMKKIYARADLFLFPSLTLLLILFLWYNCNLYHHK